LCKTNTSAKFLDKDIGYKMFVSVGKGPDGTGIV